MFRYEKVKKKTILDIFSASAYCCQYVMLHMVNGKRSLRKKQSFKTAMFHVKILIFLGRIYDNITGFDGGIERMFPPLSLPMSAKKRGTHRTTSKKMARTRPINYTHICIVPETIFLSTAPSKYLQYT